jgi:hypothetical protein
LDDKVVIIDYQGFGRSKSQQKAKGRDCERHRRRREFDGIITEAPRAPASAQEQLMSEASRLHAGNADPHCRSPKVWFSDVRILKLCGARFGFPQIGRVGRDFGSGWLCTRRRFGDDRFVFD